MVLTITGGIDLIGDNIQFAEGFSKEHYTLCRCGASNNKPFCDGMHITINLRLTIRTDCIQNIYLFEILTLPIKNLKTNELSVILNW
jgi:hypothetical protein